MYVAYKFQRLTAYEMRSQTEAVNEQFKRAVTTMPLIPPIPRVRLRYSEAQQSEPPPLPPRTYKNTSKLISILFYC